MTVDIVYETHSTSEDNERGMATGWLDGRLSARGRRQAEELGARRRHDGIRVVFTSDLGRAVETANIAFAGTDMPVITDARLRECNYGQLNGIPVSRLETERTHHLDAPYPGGESYRQVVGRVASFLADLARNWEGAGPGHWTRSYPLGPGPPAHWCGPGAPGQHTLRLAPRLVVCSVLWLDKGR